MDGVRKVFRAKHWEIFSALVVISIIQSVSEDFSNVVSVIFYVVYIIFYIGWLLVLGTGLKLIRGNQNISYRLFCLLELC